MPQTEVTNPIPFNPDTMTISQAKQCAEVLSQAFSGIERGVDPVNIIHNLRLSMEQMAASWRT